MRGFLSGGRPQWVYERVHKQLHSKREGGKYLMHNLDTLRAFLNDFGVPSDELGYKHASYQPTDLEPWYDHTVSSRALLGRSAADAKQAALSLLLKLVANLPRMSSQPVGLCLEDDTGTLQRFEATFSLQGVTQDWTRLLRQSKAAFQIWQKLQSEAWCGQLVTSSGHATTIQDILLFLSYLLPTRNWKWTSVAHMRQFAK